MSRWFETGDEVRVQGQIPGFGFLMGESRGTVIYGNGQTSTVRLENGLEVELPNQRLFPF